MKTVLFVDDQKEILELLRVKLKNKSYKALFAESSDEALEIMKREDINVIVTDLLMPGKNGIALLEQLKEEYPFVVRIVLSGLSQVTSILAAINNGDIYRYITKPWKIDEQADSVLASALEYSDFLRSQEKSEKAYTLDDLIKVLNALSFEGSLTDSSGIARFGGKGHKGNSISLSDGSILTVPPF